MTVGELKAILAAIDDDLPVVTEGGRFFEIATTAEPVRLRCSCAGALYEESRKSEPIWTEADPVGEYFLIF